MEDLAKNEKRLFWCNLCYFIILSLFVILRIVSSLGWLDFAGDYEDAIFTLLTQVCILFAVPMLVYTFAFKQKPKEIFRAFGYRKVSGKVILCSIGMGFIAFFVIMFVSSFFSVFIQMLGYEPYVTYATDSGMSVWTFLLSMLTVAVMPGIFEEFSHRGMLLSGFNKMGSVRAVVLSGLLFGLMHLNINQFFYAFVVGMLLATVALITRSIWPSVIIHFINNGLNTYLDFAAANDLFGANFNTWITLPGVNILLRFLLYILIIAIVLYVGVWLLIKMFTLTKREQFKKFVNEFSNIKDPNQPIDIDNMQELLKIYLSEGKSIDMELQNSKKPKTNDVQYANTDVPQVVIKRNADTIEVGTNQAQVKRGMTMAQLIKNLLPKNEGEKYKPTFKENFFLYCSIFLGAVVTLMTFIWGLF